ncbi:hypothetical protein MSG28_011550 [Choristoneura fumiferana]|uniref:Uncharacterized protein n=1 Tax=Choristoneura fumiferana TaxID=7141 RepID=A0ACC0JNU3_CHOFU|nr:hypothetical protein MSG28_011550 [Choristoneura fumiferana]
MVITSLQHGGAQQQHVARAVGAALLYHIQNFILYKQIKDLECYQYVSGTFGIACARRSNLHNKVGVREIEVKFEAGRRIRPQLRIRKTCIVEKLLKSRAEDSVGEKIFIFIIVASLGLWGRPMSNSGRPTADMMMMMMISPSYIDLSMRGHMQSLDARFQRLQIHLYLRPGPQACARALHPQLAWRRHLGTFTLQLFTLQVVGPYARSARIATTILLANATVKEQCLHCCVSAWRVRQPVKLLAPEI